MLLLPLLACVDAPAPADPSEAVGFEPVALSPPFQHARAVWAGVALLDVDGDGWLDIYLTNGNQHPDALYWNDGQGGFIDIAPELGLDSLDRHGGARAGDIDNDGDTDLVVTVECSTGTLSSDGGPVGDGAVVVYENRGEAGFFERRVAMEGRCPVSVELADFNRDGWLDLAVANGIDPDWLYPWIFPKEAEQAVDEVLLNDGAGVFVHRVPQYKVIEDEGELYAERVLAAVSFTSVQLDFDGDGVLDRIVAKGGEPPDAQRQEPDGFYQDNFAAPVGAGLWMGIAVADFDNDGDPDLYLSNQGYSPLIQGYDNIPGTVPLEEINPSHTLALFEEGVFARRDWPVDADRLLAGDLFDGFVDPPSNEPRYAEWMEPEGLARYPWSWAAVAVDANADGWTDVAVTGNNCSAPMDIIWDEEHGAGPGALLLNTGEGFADRTFELGVQNVDARGRYQDGRGLAVGDLDNDGYADLVYANRVYNPSQSDPLAEVTGTPRVLLNTEREAHWLQVDVEGTYSNRDGYGAVVYVDGRAHPIGAGGATNSSSERLVTVGLGQARSAEVEVLFPSGRRVSLGEVEADQRLLVVEE